MKDENRKMYLLCTWVYHVTGNIYPESFIILILSYIYKVSCASPYFSSLQYSGFTLPDNKNKQWQHLFYLSLSQRVLLLMLLLDAEHDEHKSKYFGQLLEVIIL